MRISPDTTARVIVALNRVAFTMTLIVWVVLCAIVLIVTSSVGASWLLRLGLILVATIAGVFIYAGALAYLVNQWRLMNMPVQLPLPRKTPTRRIPVTTSGKTEFLEM